MRSIQVSISCTQTSNLHILKSKRSNCRYPFFYIFVHSKSFWKILPNFKLLRTLELMFFGPLFPRIIRPSLIFLVPVLVEKWSKWRHTLKNTTRVEIIITINAENCTNIRAKFFEILYEIAIQTVIVISTRVVSSNARNRLKFGKIFRKDL